MKSANVSMKPRKPRVCSAVWQSTGELEPIVSVLQSDPEQFEQLKEDYAYSQQMQRDARQHVCPDGSGAASCAL
ncbi:hypothetical protein ACLK1T_01785 [Escherichia coli]